MLIILCFCCAFAELEVIAENVPRPASARKTPARTTNRPIKTRRLKKADREADFFFMNGYDVDGISVWSVVVAEPPLPRQHFFQFVVWLPSGFIGCANVWQAFFRFLDHGLHGPHGFLPGKGQGFGCGMVAALFTFLRNLSESERVLVAFLAPGTSDATTGRDSRPFVAKPGV